MEGLIQSFTDHNITDANFYNLFMKDLLYEMKDV